MPKNLSGRKGKCGSFRSAPVKVGKDPAREGKSKRMFRPIRSAKSLKNAFKQGKKDIPSAPFPGSCRSGWPESGHLVPEPPYQASGEFLEKANRCPAPFPAMAPICPVPVPQWTAPDDQTDFYIVAGNDSDPRQWTAPPARFRSQASPAHS
ncbi:hypothetical protein B4135_0412 [Caldibacillus debilis]|uniref:Uncharacterized protein n=1 Tax=Caldibacillus debilis TaxID=301148 RepID=A0A150L8S4_9BACI|nr:hypothetical protein B4135_0412 [Caldibacillus debilis]